MRSSRQPAAPVAAVLALVGVLALALAPLAIAFTLPPSEAGRAVYDFAGIWRSGTVDAAEATADRLRAATGVQIAVVSIPTGQSKVTTSDAERDAKLIMDTWGVGEKGKNNGIVVLFDLDRSLAHGQIYVYCGSGALSTYISAAGAQSIANDMLAKAKEGDLNAALSVGMEQIAGAVDNPGSRLESTPFLPPWTIALLVLDTVVLLFMVATWLREGRDPPIPTIDDSVLLPEPPPGMTPSMAALLRDGVATKSAPAAGLVDLASRNLIAIREGTTFLGLGRKPLDFIVSDPSDPLVVHQEGLVGSPERGMLHTLRSIATDGVVDHDQLRRAPKLQSNFAAALGRDAAATRWFRKDPDKAVGALDFLPWLTFLAVFGALFLQGETDDPTTAIVGMAGSFVTIAIGTLISRSMAARTPEGSWVLGMALAYRNTLRHEIGQAPGVVSAMQHAQLKMPWLETPDKLILWAIALGLADEVGELIGRSIDDPASANWHPVWYAGSAASFASFGSSISSITTTTSSSSGGGYGGGSSGGGGGGGGGF